MFFAKTLTKGREIKKKLNMYQRDQMHIFSSSPILFYSFISLGSNQFFKNEAKEKQIFTGEVKTQDTLVYKASIFEKNT